MQLNIKYMRKKIPKISSLLAYYSHYMIQYTIVLQCVFERHFYLGKNRVNCQTFQKKNSNASKSEPYSNVCYEIISHGK